MELLHFVKHVQVYFFIYDFLKNQSIHVSNAILNSKEH